ncbi:MAG: amylo-alpha-1,6-glucosidase [Betaproteobacteria bacterium]
MVASTLMSLLARTTWAAPEVPDPRPGREAFFADIGIEVKGQQRQFVVGDNVDGYLDAITGGYRLGPGYFMGPQVLLQDHAAYRDGQLVDRRSAAAVETVFPYGRRATVGEDSETLVLHAGARRLSLTVASPSPAMLALQPLWSFQPDAAHMAWAGDVLLITTPASPLVVALSADRPFEWTQAAVGAFESAMPVLRAKSAGTSFTVHLAFAASREQAVAQAAAMATRSDTVDQTRQACYERLTRSWLRTSDARYNRALVWAKASALSFLVDEYGRGLWAGLPWFRENWGRDTFIALPGTLLVSGQFKDAKDVLDNFARYQNLNELAGSAASGNAFADVGIGPRASDYGRIPNRVRGTEVIYNTVDGTPWMLREALEYVHYTGDREFAARALKLAAPYIEGALAHSVDADGLIAHEDADTWMDARVEGREAWSPRGRYAVEIQALWYTALLSSAELADLAGLGEAAALWRAHAARTQASFLRRFWDGKTMADRLRADGSRDLKVRPNQLLLVSVPPDAFVPLQVQAAVTRNAVRELLFPYGIASLSPNDRYFHPHHVNDAFHHKDAAYHNGTIWGWNAGFTVTALTKFGQQDLAYALSSNLSEQILGLGTVGTMSELLDALPNGQGQPKPTGSFSQAWSVAEFERNGYQDYVGFRPDLAHNRLHFVPALPAAWQHFDAVLPFGAGEDLVLRASRKAGAWRWQITLRGATVQRELVLDFLDPTQARRRISVPLHAGQATVVQWQGNSARVNGRRWPSSVVMASQAQRIGALQFASPAADVAAHFPMTRGVDVLKDIVLKGEFR